MTRKLPSWIDRSLARSLVTIPRETGRFAPYWPHTTDQTLLRNGLLTGISSRIIPSRAYYVLRSPPREWTITINIRRVCEVSIVLKRVEIKSHWKRAKIRSFKVTFKETTWRHSGSQERMFK